MVGVLKTRQALSELAFMMVVDIREISDAEAPGVPLLGTVLQMSAQNIAHCLAAGGVPTLLDEFIERTG
jgi:hypothetical protein